MKPVLDHRFDLSVADARAMQERLRGTVERKDRLGEVRTVAGVDISYDRGSPILFAAVVVLDAESHEVVETAGVTERATPIGMSSPCFARYPSRVSDLGQCPSPSMDSGAFMPGRKTMIGATPPKSVR